MLVLRFLRWLRGFVYFEAVDGFPERFLNLMLRADIPIWEPVGEKGRLTAKVSAPYYRELRNIAKKSGVRLHILQKSGLPFILIKNRDRKGLLAGLILFFVIITALSQFIWNVEISGLNALGETQVRTALKEQGLASGAYYKGLDMKKVVREATLSLKNVGWMSVNVKGVTAYVELSESYTPPDVSNQPTPGNIKARTDGQIVRMDISKGTAAVKSGDGVVKGQLLVSGVIVNAENKASLVHSEAKVYARVNHIFNVKIPFKEELKLPTGELISRSEYRIFGIRIPANLLFVPSEDYVRQANLKNITINGNGLPVNMFTENWYEYKTTQKTRSEKQAQSLAEKQLALYEAFNLQKAEIESKKTNIKKDDDFFILTADYVCIEDIAKTYEISVEE